MAGRRQHTLCALFGLWSHCCSVPCSRVFYLRGTLKSFGWRLSCSLGCACESPRVSSCVALAQCPTLGAVLALHGCLHRGPPSLLLPAHVLRPSAPAPFLSFPGGLLATFLLGTYFTPLCLSPLDLPHERPCGTVREAGLEVTLFQRRLQTPLSEASWRSVLLPPGPPPSWLALPPSGSSQAAPGLLLSAGAVPGVGTQP